MTDRRAAKPSSVGSSVVREGRIPADRPLPGLNLPDVPPTTNSVYEQRMAAAAEAKTRIADRRRFRRMLEEYNRASQPPWEHREMVVRIVLGRDRVGAVVDWRDGRMGRPGLLRRVAGPLGVNPRTVRGLGPGVALHECLRALLRDLDV